MQMPSNRVCKISVCSLREFAKFRNIGISIALQLLAICIGDIISIFSTTPAYLLYYKQSLFDFSAAATIVHGRHAIAFAYVHIYVFVSFNKFTSSVDEVDNKKFSRHNLCMPYSAKESFKLILGFERGYMHLKWQKITIHFPANQTGKQILFEIIFSQKYGCETKMYNIVPPSFICIFHFSSSIR